MCPFPTPPLLENRSQYELDAARRCPFYVAVRIRVKGTRSPEIFQIFLQKLTDLSAVFLACYWSAGLVHYRRRPLFPIGWKILQTGRQWQGKLTNKTPLTLMRHLQQANQLLPWINCFSSFYYAPHPDDYLIKKKIKFSSYTI
jgi:hypothetical protein